MRESWFSSGVATEAGAAALRYGFETVGLPEIHAVVRAHLRKIHAAVEARDLRPVRLPARFGAEAGAVLAVVISDMHDAERFESHLVKSNRSIEILDHDRYVVQRLYPDSRRGSRF